MQNSKKYRAAKALITKELYPLAEAVELVVKTSTTKFDATVELHVHLGIDPKQSSQQIRSTVSLPNGTGKSKRVAAFVGEDQVREAREAGAEFAGSDDLIEKVQKEEWTDFDIAVATPDMMKKMAKLGKILGTKGLMPNPKAGTVTLEVAKTIKEIKGGRLEFKNDPASIVHTIIGKVSFGPEKLLQNAKTFFEALKSLKPADLKGSYIKSISLTTSMGPGINVEVF